MSDENDRFWKSAQKEDVTYSNDGLLIAGQVVVRNVDGRFISGMTPDLCRILRLEARDHDDISVRVKRLTELLNEGRKAEAIFIASLSRLYRQSGFPQGILSDS